MPRKVSRRAKTLAATNNPAFHLEGKMSTFGGPLDTGMTPSEGLALFTKSDLSDPKFSYLFLPAPPPGTTGLGRRLNPDSFYIACRWDYHQTSKDFLRNTLALIQNPQNNKTAQARPVDWGPNASTGRSADFSPGLAATLGLDTDDDVIITLSAGSSTQRSLATDAGGGHGSNNPIPKPIIKQFIQSPNHSSRNGAKISTVVLHCTEASLQSTIKTFQDPGGRQVSAHYIVDRTGDIYQMVRDDDRANHCKGANANSIGIEHVASAKDAMATAQAKSSAALIRWLVGQYDIARSSIYGHAFTPGYSGGGTSCPDKLFGADHTEQAVLDWVAKNV
jgi:hypothetical protein